MATKEQRHQYYKNYIAKYPKKSKELAHERWKKWAQIHGKKGKTIEEKFHSRYEIVPESGCWLWTGAVVGRRPYGRIRINGENIPAHRLSWELKNGKIPKGLLVLHRCDVTYCVNPSHLFIGNQFDNVHDMIKKERRVIPDRRGIKSSRAKLNEAQVKVIRKSELSHYVLSKLFSVNTGTIFNIKKGKTWKHVT